MQHAVSHNLQRSINKLVEYMQSGTSSADSVQCRASAGGCMNSNVSILHTYLDWLNGSAG